jgi:acyl-CoA synthetase (AMP-forming)/AMP-acid ligase II
MFSRPFCGGRLGEGEEDRGIHSILCLQAREQPAGIAAVTLGDEGGDIVSKVTWSQLLHATQQLAAELLRANVQNGDRIAILGHNCEMFLAALFACSMIGAVSVPLNPRWSIQELGFAVGDCQPAFCLCFDGIEFSALSSICMDKVLAVMLPKLVLAYEPQPLGSSCSSMHSHALSSTPGQKLRCRSTILYTSGSTGSPKGVILSHSGQLAQASAKCQEVGYWGHTLYLNVAPLCHVGGFNSALACSLAGGRHVFLSYKFNPDAAMAAIEAASVSLLVLVPAMLHMMLESFIKDRPLETVRTILVGGQSMSDSLLARAHATFSAAQIFQTYASTEAGST